MQTDVWTDPGLTQLRAAVRALYGDRLARLVLFGSRARGDAGAHSDCDVAVFLTEMPDRYAELRRLADISAEILDTTGAVVNATAFRADAFDDPRMPLMHEIRREGVAL